jgi:hypothetical protein
MQKAYHWRIFTPANNQTIWPLQWWIIAPAFSTSPTAGVIDSQTVKTTESGADAAPYFRVFNPTIQGTKFDPDGSYVRRWVPEISRLPDRLIHAPWTAKPIELADAGIELGKDYPAPIVDHAMARNRALEKYKLLKAG